MPMKGTSHQTQPAGSSVENQINKPGDEGDADMADDDDLEDPKPRNALSSYNLYFQIERKRILDGTDAQKLPITPDDVRAIMEEHKNKKKRVHRKSHGVISFKSLARTIADRWKLIDPPSKQVLEHFANLEKQKYSREFKAWKARKKQRETIHAARVRSQAAAGTAASSAAASSNLQTEPPHEAGEEQDRKRKAAPQSLEGNTTGNASTERNSGTAAAAATGASPSLGLESAASLNPDLVQRIQQLVQGGGPAMPTNMPPNSGENSHVPITRLNVLREMLSQVNGQIQHLGNSEASFGNVLSGLLQQQTMANSAIAQPGVPQATTPNFLPQSAGVSPQGALEVLQSLVANSGTGSLDILQSIVNNGSSNQLSNTVSTEGSAAIDGRQWSNIGSLLSALQQQQPQQERRSPSFSQEQALLLLGQQLKDSVQQPNSQEQVLALLRQRLQESEEQIPAPQGLAASASQPVVAPPATAESTTGNPLHSLLLLHQHQAQQQQQPQLLQPQNLLSHSGLDLSVLTAAVARQQQDQQMMNHQQQQQQQQQQQVPDTSQPSMRQSPSTMEQAFALLQQHLQSANSNEQSNSTTANGIPAPSQITAAASLLANPIAAVENSSSKEVPQQQSAFQRAASPDTTHNDELSNLKAMLASTFAMTRQEMPGASTQSRAESQNDEAKSSSSQCSDSKLKQEPNDG